MFSIIKCPKCGMLQGAGYPIRSTRCKRCGRDINIRKHPPIGTYGTLKEMQANLMGLKWDKEELPLERCKFSRSFVRNRESNDISKIILGQIGDKGICLRDLLDNVKEKGIPPEEAENILDLLKRNGDIFSPRPGYFKRV